MKKLAAILLSGSLVCALCVLGGTGTAAGNAPGSGISTDVPAVTGELLNPAFFAHGAYVMQGVSDPTRVFALPLLGVPELSFFPTASGTDPSAVTWRLEVSHPEGIGAEIRDSILYIWGKSATWTGYGAVTLTGTAGNASGSVVIPVTVFRTDKTLINPEGKKDYFVPWAPQLDINRILSVEEHIRKYNKDEGALDRTIRWSTWRKMEYMRGAVLFGPWNWETMPSWTPAAWRLSIDNTLLELKALGCDAVSIWQNYIMETQDAPEPSAVYNRYGPGGVTLTAEELGYLADESHRLGLSVLITPTVHEQPGQDRCDFHPPSYDVWFRSLSDIGHWNADIALATGADVFVAFHNMGLATSIRKGRLTWERWNEGMLDVVASARECYPGPVAHLPGSLQVAEYYNYRDMAPLFEAVDIIGGNSNFAFLPVGASPTVEELETLITDRIRTLIEPGNLMFNKPMLMNEGFMGSFEGAVRDFDFTGSPGTVYDGGEQATWYEAYFRSERKFPFLYGFGWAAWDLLPGRGGVGDLNATPRLKPAQQVIEKAYRGEVAPHPAAVDGDMSEWQAIAPVFRSQAATGSQARLSCVRSVSDSMYQYVQVEVSTPVRAPLQINILIDDNRDGVAEFPLAVAPGAGSWWATLFDSMSWSSVRGLCDVASSADGRAFELRVPRLFLGTESSPAMQVELVDLNTHRTLSATTWFSDGNVPGKAADASSAPEPAWLLLTEIGRYTSAPGEVIAGRRSISGSYSGVGGYTPYLRTDPSILQLIGGHTYRVSFDYCILVPNAKGFETLFYSPQGGSEGKWLASKTLYGPAGSSGTATLTATLLGYSDYEVRWNIVATGAIVIDNIVLTDLTTGQIVAAEDAEQ